MQETANKQKRITLKTIHEMLDGMSVELVEKVHLLFMAFFDFPRPLLAKRGSTSPCSWPLADLCHDSAKHTSMMAFAAPSVISPQAREKLRISRIPHSQSSGIAREACALKGERCVFYEMDINLEVFNLETDFFGDLHCSSRFTDMLCDAQTQYGDYSELEKCPIWGMWVKEGGE